LRIDFVKHLHRAIRLIRGNRDVSANDKPVFGNESIGDSPHENRETELLRSEEEKQKDDLKEAEWLVEKNTMMKEALEVVKKAIEMLDKIIQSSSISVTSSVDSSSLSSTPLSQPVEEEHNFRLWHCYVPLSAVRIAVTAHPTPSPKVSKNERIRGKEMNLFYCVIL
jgi:hypothetical protein